MTQVNQVLQKTKQLLAQAQELYGLDLSHVGIRFDLRGRAAGQACRRGAQYYIRYNRDMLTREAFDHVYNNTVPHEIAHIVCFMNPRLGSNHDAGWARVCRQLGGNAERCHSEEVVYGKGNTYEYITDRGNKVRVGNRYHEMVQRGQVVSYRKGIGKITKECQCSIVGVSGRSIAPRIIKHAESTVVAPVVAETKEVPVESIIPVAPAPVLPAQVVEQAVQAGASKASISRNIMLTGYTRGDSYETIIAAMMTACGYTRQLARATYKANAAKVGIPNA